MKRKIFRILSAVLSLILLPILPGVAEQLLPETEEPLVQKMPMDKSSTDDGMDVYADAAEVQPNDAGNVSLLESDDSKGMETKDIVSDIAIPSELQLGVKEKFVIDAKGATFKTSKKSVATVSKKGVVTGKKKGTAKITVKKGGNLIATCVVTVLAAPKKITLSQKKLTLKTGDNITLTVKVPKKTASRINWSSNDSNVAEVDDTGTVIGVGLGSAKITARTFNGKKATCVVTVKAKNPPLSISFPMKDLSIGLKESVIVAPVIDEGAEAVFTWSTKNKKIAAVSGAGEITGRKVGSTKITVRTQNGLKATLTVKVLKAPKKVALDPAEATLDVNGTMRLTAKLPQKTASRITWTSSDEAVATVDEAGLVTGVSPGEATVTARTFNGKTATCVVTVTGNVAPTVTPEPPSGEESSLDDFVIENGVITKYVGPGGDVVIPRVDKDGNAITEIGEYAFKFTANLTSVIIPDSVNTVGKYAFYSCSSLIDVSIPHSVKTISNGMFSGCKSLTCIVLPYGVETIDYWAFRSCKNLKSITIPQSVTYISNDMLGYESDAVMYVDYDSYALRWCEKNKKNCILPGAPEDILDYTAENGTLVRYTGSRENVVVPSVDKYGHTITALGNKAFFNNDGLVSVSIPDTITKIEDGIGVDSYGNLRSGAFIGCENLTSVTLPDSIEYIGSGAFSACHKLASISIPESVTYIGERAFKMSGLTSVTIPSGVATISKECFFSCNNLTEVILSDGVNRIDEWAFGYCENLDSITIPKSVNYIWWIRSYLNAFSDSPACTAKVEYGSYAHEWFKEQNYRIVITGSECDPYNISFGGGKTEALTSTLEGILAMADSDVYNPDLAYLLMSLSAAAYNDVKSTDTDGNLLSFDQVPYIGPAYLNLGFQHIAPYKYYDSPYAEQYGSHSVAAMLGERILNGGHRIVLVTVRGSWSPDGKLNTPDWKSNFDLLHGSDGLHEGFKIATSDLFNALQSFMDGHMLDENVTYVLTGHSRGAAVANLLAKMLDDAGVDDKRVFDYNFACPDVARLSISYDWESGHKNMFNISYTADPVGVIPGVAGDLLGNLEVGTAWGKFGRSYYFTDAWDTPDEFDLSRLFANPSSHDPKRYVNMMQNRSASTFHSWSEVAAKRLIYFTATDIDDVIVQLVERIGE